MPLGVPGGEVPTTDGVSLLDTGVPDPTALSLDFIRPIGTTVPVGDLKKTSPYNIISSSSSSRNGPVVNGLTAGGTTGTAADTLVPGEPVGEAGGVCGGTPVPVGELGGTGGTEGLVTGTRGEPGGPTGSAAETPNSVEPVGEPGSSDGTEGLVTGIPVPVGGPGSLGASGGNSPSPSSETFITAVSVVLTLVDFFSSNADRTRRMSSHDIRIGNNSMNLITCTLSESG